MKLKEAILKGDTTEVTAILKDHTEALVEKDEEENTPLHIATKAGLHDMVLHLLKHNADTEALDCKALTPLYWAADFGFHDIVLSLLAHNACVEGNKNEQSAPSDQSSYDSDDASEKKEDDNLDPLHLAAVNGHHNVVLTLLAHKAPPDTDNHRLNTPLHLATGARHPEVALTLIAHKASVNIENCNGRTPLHWASGQGFPELIQVLTKHKADIEAQDEEGCSPLHMAAGMTPPHVIAYELLFCKTNTQCVSHEQDSTNDGKHHHNEAILALLSCKAKIAVKNNQNHTPLTIAIQQNTPKPMVIETLINHKADMEAQDNEQYTPLFCAIKQGQIDMALTLIKCKANTNAMRSTSPYTPMDAIVKNYYNIKKNCHIDPANLIATFIAHKANIEARNKKQETILHFAATQASISFTPQKIIACLSEHKADLEARDAKQRTPLFAACAKALLNNALTLLNHKADIEAIDVDQRTPLHIAAMNRNASNEKILNVINHLLHHKANVHARDNKRYTPLHGAADRWATTDSSTITRLINHKADLAAKDANQRTPLHLAANKDYHHMMMALTRHSRFDPNLWSWTDINGYNPLHYAIKSRSPTAALLAHPKLPQDAWLARDGEGYDSLQHIIIQSQRNGSIARTIRNYVLNHPTLSFALSVRYHNAKGNDSKAIAPIEAFTQSAKQPNIAQIKKNGWWHLLYTHLDTINDPKTWIGVTINAMTYRQEHILRQIAKRMQTNQQLFDSIAHKLLDAVLALFGVGKRTSANHDYRERVLVRACQFPKPFFAKTNNPKRLRMRLIDLCTYLSSPVRHWLVQSNICQHPKWIQVLQNTHHHPSPLHPFLHEAESSHWEATIAQFIAESAVNLMLTARYYYYRFHPMGKINHVVKLCNPKTMKSPLPAKEKTQPSTTIVSGGDKQSPNQEKSAKP